MDESGQQTVAADAPTEYQPAPKANANPDPLAFRVSKQTTRDLRELLLLVKHRPELRRFNFARVSDVARTALCLGLEHLQADVADEIWAEQVRQNIHAQETGKPLPYPDAPASAEYLHRAHADRLQAEAHKARSRRERTPIELKEARQEIPSMTVAELREDLSAMRALIESLVQTGNPLPGAGETDLVLKSRTRPDRARKDRDE